MTAATSDAMALPLQTAAFRVTEVTVSGPALRRGQVALYNWILAPLRGLVVAGDTDTYSRFFLDDRFVLHDDPRRIQQFVAQHPFIAPAVNRAYDEIQHFFPGAPVLLEVVEDPEDETARQVVATVQTSLDPSAALERLRAFDRAWWLGQLQSTEDRFTVTIGYA